MDDIRKLSLSILQLNQEFKKAQELRVDMDRITFETLLLIKAKERIRPSAIAKEFDLNPSSITRRLQPLMQEGLVEVTADPNDLRSSLIHLTNKGDNALTQFLERSVEGMTSILADWNEDDIHTIANLLSRLTDTLKDWRHSRMGNDSD
jgi:DNA-binding MarR family transcriptional regulator